MAPRVSLRGNRVLVCGAVYPSGTGGGLPLALHDLADSLTWRGWDVDLAITPGALGFPAAERDAAHFVPWSAAKWNAVPRLRFLPEHVRTALQHVLLDGGAARVQSDLMRAIETRLHQRRYDVVVAYVSREAPGFARFIIERHPNVLLVSLNGLAQELRLARWLAAARLTGRIATIGRLHPCMYRPVDPRQIRMAVFASEAWREDAVRAGLPPQIARTIYFGVSSGCSLPDPAAVQGRLLWVGRCSPEKGLHHFIDAVALLRQTRSVTLTAVCGSGPASYRQSVVKRIERLGLGNAVQLIPPVPRAALRNTYASHDALLFHSPFAEPVALVLLEAFSAGIPVVAPSPVAPARLLRPDDTCVCFSSSAPSDIATAVRRILDTPELRDRVRRRARDLIGRRFSIEAMGAAYDASLTELIG